MRDWRRFLVYEGIGKGLAIAALAIFILAVYVSMGDPKIYFVWFVGLLFLSFVLAGLAVLHYTWSFKRLLREAEKKREGQKK